MHNYKFPKNHQIVYNGEIVRSMNIASIKLHEVYNHETNSDEGAELVDLSSAVGTLRREGE